MIKDMTKIYYELYISAETQAQADRILDALLDKKLVTGGQFIAAPARFLWKGKIENMQYVTITSFSTSDHKKDIIDVVESVSEEEVPMIRFVNIESNEKLNNWIDETLD
jgi:uncharacterized protein involved in tolerance to divalent cations